MRTWERENVGTWGRGNGASSAPASLRRFVAPSLLPAFTLIEMLVSLAVLGLALAVVGTVFSITTKATGQAAAYSEAQNWVRQFTAQLEQDLKYCDPANSVLVLVGRTQAAALKAEDLQARKYYRVLLGNAASVSTSYDPEYAVGLDNADPLQAQYSNPRADLLMFFTNRPTVSQSPPPNSAAGSPMPVISSAGEAAANGVKFSPIQVVYGHAALADPVLSGTSYSYPPLYSALQHIEKTVNGTASSQLPSIIPANHWHLARRQVIITEDPGEVSSAYTHHNAKVTFETYGGRDDWQQVTRCEADTNARPLPGDMVLMNLPLFLSGFGPDSTLSAATLSPYTFSPGYPSAFPSYDSQWTTKPSAWGVSMQWQQAIYSLLYMQGSEYGAFSDLGANHHVATVLTSVPAELRSNMGVQLLPGCAWFQVEFLMPEDPRNSREYAPDPDPTKGRPLRTDLPRWTAIEPGKTYVFVPDSPENREIIAKQVTKAPSADVRFWQFARLDQDPTKDEITHGVQSDSAAQRVIRLWPYAIRVTVRVYDARGRLDQPIVRSVVHRFD